MNERLTVLIAQLDRADRVYRSYGPDSTAGMLGCGTIPKPSAAAVRTHFQDIGGYSGVYLLRGGGVYRDQTSVDITLRPGDWFHRIPGRTHESIPDDSGQWLEFFIFLPEDWYTLHVDSGLFSADEPVWRPGLDADLLERLLGLREQMRHPSRFHAPEALVAMQACLLRAHQLHVRKGDSRHGEPRLDNAPTLLEADLDRSLDVEKTARALGMGYETFRKEFRKRFGIAPGAHRMRARMDAARALLARADLQVKEVAARLGFPDVYAFSKQFKRSTGLSPTAYRCRMP